MIDPGDHKTEIAKPPYSIPSNGVFQFSGCQDQTVTHDGVLTDCKSRSRNASAQSSNSGSGQLNGYNWMVESPNDSHQNYHRRRSCDAVPYYREKNLADGWVLLDVKMLDKDEADKMRHRAFIR